MTEAVVRIDQDGDAAVRITVSGEIDMDNSRQVEHQILAAISNQFTTVTLDLSGMDYIDSAGIRVLFILGNRLETLQIAVRLLVPTKSPIRRTIDLSGVAGIIPVSSN
jgi:stage II sporulation protein AA (anti-sigma F factor antagonist)